MIINENYHINIFTNGKDIYLNFDKWKSGEITKIIIIGLSGSGKSTLGRKIAQEYNCPYVELDKFRGNVYYSDKEMKTNHYYIYKYFNDIWEYGDRHNVKTLNKEIRTREFEKFVYWLLDQPERLVIEGNLEKILWNDEELRHHYPIIMKNTSMIKSMIRMSYREFTRNDTHNDDRNAWENLCWWARWCMKYNTMKNQQNKLRDKIMSGFDMSKYEEIEESYKIHL